MVPVTIRSGFRILNKTRMVFYAASRYKGTSLNEQLLQRADLNSLVSVLTQFRFSRYAALADINNMFLQVRLTPEDKGVTKFLFWETYILNKLIVEYQMKIIIRDVMQSHVGDLCISSNGQRPRLFHIQMILQNMWKVQCM